ncbi:UDP-3-O-(3-hydroxymyristoyl)glucosamine N-acyltransferase [Luteolibacter pohnpeiensis]|uniref:UDP-3-O-acylglucosamine N-acyltransferase n=1 Tax=Luteolibacter pohnpeiensis TaxID=454153 RepID=A0A934S7Z8_9BACT|nr:UDP-3-O-(3-hydroxymyristoyl)glucosamine N-acyltransferase [Luteolibacter pohnpeiensis]MBK1883862.1 UDP-3-O-(3-hydroxymyristoyl)glucosamine N-acyltransferase [Luteolibacter pohnpeiensis]
MALALTLQQLAQLAGGSIVRGELSVTVTGLAALDAAGPDDVSFLGNEKYRSQFAVTKAAAVIVPPGEYHEGTAALIVAENPSLAFAAIVRHFAAATRSIAPGIHPRATVDETAELDPATVCVQAGAIVMAGAKIGKNTRIGPNVVVGEDVVIGDDCHLMANVTIRERCVLGHRVILQPGAVIGADGYGYEFSGGRHVKIDQVGIVEIGDDVEIGANTTIDRARFGKTVIGEGTKIDNLVQIGHNTMVGKHCLIISQSGIAGSSKIEDYVTIAAQVGIVGHVSVGSKAILTARTGVTASIPGGETYAGKPAIPMREEMKFQAHLRRLPKLISRVKSLESKMAEAESAD